MWEDFEMDDGTMVRFYSSLSYSGIRVDVKKEELGVEKRDDFMRQLRSERDVVSIKFV